MTKAIDQTAQEQQAQQIVDKFRAIVDDLLPTRTEQEVDELLEQLEEAELVARLAASAAWRA